MRQHPTEEELALYVEALALDVQEQLPVEILEHVQECIHCKAELIELAELVNAQEPYICLETHPCFGWS